MKKAYVTVSGMDYYCGNEFVQPGMEIAVTLKKEPDNEYDKEAILVWTEGLGDIGHVANSWKTVVGGTMSTGRLYDKIGDIFFPFFFTTALSTSFWIYSYL